MKRMNVLGLAAAMICMMPLMGMGQDRIEQLEKKIQLMESQLGEMKEMLQAQKVAPAAEPAVEDSAVTKLIGPGGTLGIGGDLRFRGMYFDNVWDFDDNNAGDSREVFRFRPRIYFDWNPTDDLEAYVRFTKEWFYGQDEEMPGYDVEGKDAMIDNAWVLSKDIFGTGIDAKIGRQDLIYGDGFVLLDGTPYDGSQTISFDAVKVTVNHDWGASDLLFAKLSENDFQAADDEDLYGIYNRFKFGQTGVEPYLLYRNKNQVSIDGFNPPDTFDPSPAEETLLLGLRSSHTFALSDSVDLALAGEIGKEWGKVDFDTMDGLPGSLQFSRLAGSGEVDRDAWGGQANGTLTFKDIAWTPSLKLGFTYTTGDDPNTEDYEGWDDFYAQWPKYSELYVYSLYDGFKGRNGGNDADIGVWGNMLIPEAMITVKPTKQWTQSLRYLYFMADEDTGPGSGDERGQNIQLLTNYVFTQNISGHILFEWFDPGDYYADGADDAIFTRFQLMYKF
ncbi:MAG: alginate export family protein [Candidatus Hinthialibacter antarcticus]|nr:alginate export family protein [Candidatus Hinthialibacter antarcticus]